MAQLQKSKNIFLAISLGVMLYCNICCSKPQKSRPKVGLKPFIYSLEKGGVTSYVIGTIHFGVSLVEVENTIDRFFIQTDVHFYEKILPRRNVTYFGRVPIDPLNLYRSELYSTAIAQGERPVSSDVVRSLVAIGVPEPVAVSMSPQDCEIIYHRKLLFSGKSMDFEALGRSYDLGKKMIQLDTPELRQTAKSLDTESGMDFSCRVEKLAKNLKEIESIDQTINTSLIQYLKGDESKFQNATPGVDYRNRDWVRQIAPVAQKKPVLIIVGVSHLLGSHGLFQAFQRRGFRVQRIGQRK